MSEEEFDLNEFLPYQLAVAASRVSREFSTLYSRKFGISVPEWRVIAHLNQSGRVSVREIHQKVDMDKSKVSRAASRLEQNGYVQKEPDQKDGRLVALTLTAKGKSMFDEILPMARKFEANLLENLTNGQAFQAALQEFLSTDQNQSAS